MPTTSVCFTANVGEIIETSRGRSKTREFRSFNLVAPTGYLIMVCMCDEMNDVMPVMSYLAGAGTIDHIAKGRWSFHTVTSEWKGELVTPGDTIPINTNGTPKSYKEQLQARMQSLESELSQVSALLKDRTRRDGQTRACEAREDLMLYLEMNDSRSDHPRDPTAIIRHSQPGAVLVSRYRPPHAPDETSLLIREDTRHSSLFIDPVTVTPTLWPLPGGACPPDPPADQPGHPTDDPSL
jgi:hypothetical protein